MAFWLKKLGTNEKELSKRLREKLNTQESMTRLRVPNHPPYSPSPSPFSRSPFRGRCRSCDQSTDQGSVNRSSTVDNRTVTTQVFVVTGRIVF